jgi:hypothetical protein
MKKETPADPRAFKFGDRKDAGRGGRDAGKPGFGDRAPRRDDRAGMGDRNRAPMSSAPMSACMASIISSVNWRIVMPRSSARLMILSSMSVMFRTYVTFKSLAFSHR